MEKLLRQVKELEKQISNYEKLQTSISTGSIGWHIEHALLVFETIITAVENSEPSLYTSSFKMNKFIVFTLNKIPRGRAKAPKVVQPVGELIPEKMRQLVEIVTEKIKGLPKLQKNHHFPHPFFGNLNLKETIKFLKIHTNHHLKIINDILKSS